MEKTNASSDVSLLIDGHEFFGWQEVEVVRSIESMAGRFRLKLTEIEPDPVPRNKPVELYLNGKLIISGFIYTVSVNVAGQAHSVSVNGRDKTADMVDADVLQDSQELHNLTLREIAETLAEPFGVTVIAEADPPERFKKFSFQQESAFEALDRACRLRGVFPSADESGNLLIRKYGTTRAATSLIMGQNVLSAEASYDDTDRFSEYRVIGQQPGTDGVEADQAAGPSGRATDQGMGRYRPKIIIAEAAVDGGLAQKRAEWEATVRAARAVTITATVQDWTQSDGELWRENQLVRATLPQHGINGDMLIKEVTFSRDDSAGTITNLALVRPDAYTMQPDLEAEENKRSDQTGGGGDDVPVTVF